MRRWMYLFCLLLALSGCGGSGGSQPTNVPTNVPTIVPTIVPELITYQQAESGAEAYTIVTVLPDGLARVTIGPGEASPREFQLPEALFAELKQLVESQEFQALEPVYGTDVCPDCYKYTIAAPRTPEAHMIRTNDAATKPPALQKLLDIMAQIMSM